MAESELYPQITRLIRNLSIYTIYGYRLYVIQLIIRLSRPVGLLSKTSCKVHTGGFSYLLIIYSYCKTDLPLKAQILAPF